MKEHRRDRVMVSVAMIVSLVVLADCSPQGTAWARPDPVTTRGPSVTAKDAGAPAPGKSPEAGLPAPPRLPRDSRRACRKDADCVLVPSRPCTCPVCGTAWREVLNRTAVDKLQAIWAKRRCVQRPCPQCASRLLGTKAVCRTGQCMVE